MPTPQELARTAEQYDEEQWFEFLDELDAVSRRRQRRAEEPAPPAAAGRDTMAHWMAGSTWSPTAGSARSGTSRRARPPTRSAFSR